MAKSNSTGNTPTGGNGSPKPNYAYKPAKIGAVLKTLMERKNIDKHRIAEFMKVTVRCVERWLEKAYLTMQQMLKLSELFGENLLLLYNPNVPPQPNPLQDELDKTKGYLKNMEGIEKEKEKFRTENKSLRDQVELLKEMLEKKNGR